MTDELLNVAQTAEYLGGISRATVYRLKKDGKLSVVKVRGSTFFRRSALDRYLRDAERTSAA